MINLNKYTTKYTTTPPSRATNFPTTKYSPKHSSTSFTLIELLVVVAIMGLLAVMGVIAFNHVQAKARDAKRDADLEAFATAMELYMNANNSYPDTTSSTYCLETECDGVSEPSWCTDIRTYMPDIPSDPLNGSSRDYCYLFNSDGNDYRVGAVLEKDSTRMESDSGLYTYFLEEASDFDSIPLTDWSGVWLGGDLPWSCGLALTYEEIEYDTVQIGTQCWFAEHLNVGTMLCEGGGTTCATEQENDSVLEKYCYQNSVSYCASDGALYQWAEAMDLAYACNADGSCAGQINSPHQGICPSGWHIPTDDEYKTLEMYLGMSQADADATSWRGTDEGTKLKVGGSSGFEGFLAGFRYTDGSFNNRSANANIWSSLESGGNAWRRHLRSGYATVYRDTLNKLYGFSVRCLKD